MADIEAAWERALTEYESAGYSRDDVNEWDRIFWESGYKQALRESGGSR